MSDGRSATELEMDGEVLAEEDAGPAEAEPRLPQLFESAPLPVLRGEARTAALAAAGGVLAGAATVAAVRAVGAAGARRRSGGRLLSRRQARRGNVVASRSFLIDVHLLGDR